MSRRPKGTGSIRTRGDVILAGTLLHVIIAERVLGRRLPLGACVHHADGDPGNNAHNNLVICPSQAYHSLLHTRIRATKECGNPNWRKCFVCKHYDSPDKLSFYRRSNRANGERAIHPACNRANVVRYKQLRIVRS